jgi:hypothetical protein
MALRLNSFYTEIFSRCVKTGQFPDKFVASGTGLRVILRRLKDLARRIYKKSVLPRARLIKNDKVFNRIPAEVKRVFRQRADRYACAEFIHTLFNYLLSAQCLIGSGSLSGAGGACVVRGVGECG